MNDQERKNRIYELYAKLGELSLVKKQALQKQNAIDKEIEIFENEVIKILNTTPTKEVDHV